MFAVDSPSGFIVIGDAELVPHGEKDLSPAELRERAKRGDLFLIDAEDAVKYRMELIPNGDVPPVMANEFVPHGGAFRLRVPSGQVQIGPFPFSSTAQVSVTPGDYLVSTFVRCEFDAALFNERMKQIVGRADWQFHRRIENFGCAGCLSLAIGVGIVLCTPSFPRQYWWVPVLIFGVPALLSYLMKKLPRYKRIQRQYDSYSAEFPDFVILLKPSAAAVDLPGGWVPGI